MTTPADSGPKLLLDWQEKPSALRLLRDCAASIAVNVILLWSISGLASLETGGVDPARVPASLRQTITPLIAPPPRLTQKAPNKAKPAKEVKLENLLPEPERHAHLPTPPAPPPKQFQPPVPKNTAPSPKPPVIAPEPPKIEASNRPPQILPPSQIHPGPAASDTARRKTENRPGNAGRAKWFGR